MNTLQKFGGVLTMATTFGFLSGCGKDPTQALAMERTAKVASILDVPKQQISREQRLASHIGYLTTLQQLGNGSDLDEIFDGSIHLGDEEPMTVYSLLDIINGNNSFSHLAPPKAIHYDRNWALDSSFTLGYEQLKDPKTGKPVFRLREINGTKNLVPHWLGDTRLKLNYNSLGIVESVYFERPNIHVNETIHIKRNEQGLVYKLDIGNALKVDNSITIEYYEGSDLPYSLHQTKYGAFEDTTLFAYDPEGNLSKIIYVPAISAKAVKSIVRRGGRGAKGALQATEDAMMDLLKRTKGLDVVNIQSINSVPTKTHSELNSSHWYYTKGMSEFQWNGTMLESMYLRHEDFPVDDKKKITFVY